MTPQEIGWSSEGCGLTWTIEKSDIDQWARRYDVSSKEDRKYMRRDWRSQRASSQQGSWLIGHPSEGGEIELSFFPPTDAPITKQRTVEIFGRGIGRCASEAEARLVVAHYTFGTDPGVTLDAYLATLGYSERKDFIKNVRFFTKELKGGEIHVIVREASTNKRGWRFGRSVDVDWSPYRSSRWHNIATLEDMQAQAAHDGDTPVRPIVPFADPFLADVIAAVSVAEARLAANGPGRGMTKPLVSPQEAVFIAPLLSR